MNESAVTPQIQRYWSLPISLLSDLFFFFVLLPTFPALIHPYKPAFPQFIKAIEEYFLNLKVYKSSNNLRDNYKINQLITQFHCSLTFFVLKENHI